MYSGCTVKGYEYEVDYISASNLRLEKINSVNVHETAVALDIKPQIRSVKMISPYGGTFTEYLKISIEEHLKAAMHYNSDSNITMNIQLTKNVIDIWNMYIGKSDLEMKLIITKNNINIYENTYSVQDTFRSGWIGETAMNNAVKHYPIVIQKLVNKLFEDKKLLQILMVPIE
jgi:hypothetical protein